MGITEEELEEIVLAVQEDAAKTRLPDTAARAVGVLTTKVGIFEHACNDNSVAVKGPITSFELDWSLRRKMRENAQFHHDLAGAFK